jgi:hypothetical protein
MNCYTHMLIGEAITGEYVNQLVSRMQDHARSLPDSTTFDSCRGRRKDGGAGNGLARPSGLCALSLQPNVPSVQRGYPAHAGR